MEVFLFCAMHKANKKESLGSFPIYKWLLRPRVPLLKRKMNPPKNLGFSGLEMGVLRRPV